MRRVDTGYHYNFRVNSKVFKDDKSKTEAKTNSGCRVCLLLVKSPPLACREHAQSPLFAHYMHTYTLTHLHGTSLPIADMNFLTYFTRKGGPSILTCFMFLLWPTILPVFYGLPYYFSTIFRATSTSMYTAHALRKYVRI